MSIYDKSIDDLDLSVRCRNALDRGSIATVGQLCSKSEFSLYLIKGFGRTSMREVKTVLAELGLKLGTIPPEVRPAPDTNVEFATPFPPGWEWTLYSTRNNCLNEPTIACNAIMRSREAETPTFYRSTALEARRACREAAEAIHGAL